MQKLALPYRGINKGSAVAMAPSEYSSNMNNVRPSDVLEKKIRMGQRPGLKKASDSQVGGTEQPVVWIGSVASVS